MQTVSHGGFVKGSRINFRTILVKGILWALIGAFLGFAVSEFTDKNITSEVAAAIVSGHSEFVEYYEAKSKSDAAFAEFDDEYKKWCRKNHEKYGEEGVLGEYLLSDDVSAKARDSIEEYFEYEDEADAALVEVYVDEYNEDGDDFGAALASVSRTGTAMWSAIIALFVGLSLGIGEGVYYGSKEKALKYALIGAGVSLIIGYFSGYLAQWMYSEMLSDDPAKFTAAFVRGLGWAIMGIGIGLSVGLIKPEVKRILFCTIGGMVGAFIGGFLFNFVCDIIPSDVVARGTAIVIMGILIGIGVGLLEQFAKAAWLKVVRGEFEGKEYLVFAGTTSIGNDGRNTIVLFKDKLVASHHCDIVLEGSKYVLIDAGTPMGTIVNGQRAFRHILRQGDAIAIGNSVLVFNNK
ncbi:MAG: FHA domain-containing protein [Ruminococcaceae bacterium]|nr:FHA domain-containing protein [Oscillospiraceae bacterium]